MASSYLGPESPRPLAVISESYQHRFRIPSYPHPEIFHFGEQYDESMFDLISKYLDLETTDRLCYVGDAKGSFADKIVDRFCLLEPMLTIIPGHYSYVETESNKMLPIRVANTGAEEFFRLQAEEKPENRQMFNKFMLKDSLRYFENPTELYSNAMKCLKPGGKMLIIHRPSSISTLPVFRDAKKRIEDNEIPYTDLIKDLQSCDYNVQWEIECLPIVMTKQKWYSMLHSKFPPQMEILSDFEVRSGVRELSEGILKYEGDTVEFNDRLLFISVTNPERKTKGYPSIKRYGASDLNPYPTVKNLRYAMEVTDDLKSYLAGSKRETMTSQGVGRKSGVF